MRMGSYNYTDHRRRPGPQKTRRHINAKSPHAPRDGFSPRARPYPRLEGDKEATNLRAEGQRLYEIERKSVDLDQTSASFAVGDGDGGPLSSEALDGVFEEHLTLSLFLSSKKKIKKIHSD